MCELARDAREIPCAATELQITNIGHIDKVYSAPNAFKVLASYDDGCSIVMTIPKNAPVVREFLWLFEAYQAFNGESPQ